MRPPRVARRCLPLAFLLGLVPTAGCPYVMPAAMYTQATSSSAPTPSASSGNTGLVERSVAFSPSSPQGLALLPIEIRSNGQALTIPKNAQLALAYRDATGAELKTDGMQNDGPAIALLLAPGHYTITGLDAIATACPDGSVQTAYRRPLDEPLELVVVAGKVSYLGRLRIETRCFQDYTGKTRFRQEGSTTVAERESFWTVQVLGTTRKAELAADLPGLRRDYANVAWNAVEVRDLAGPAPATANAVPTASAAPAATAPPPAATVEPAFLLVPHGRYKGAGAGVTAELTLSADSTFVLTWSAERRLEQGQWTGRFAWIKGGIGDSLSLREVREAINARRSSGFRDETLAVTRVDRARNAFAVSLGNLGTVEFQPSR